MKCSSKLVINMQDNVFPFVFTCKGPSSSTLRRRIKYFSSYRGTYILTEYQYS